MCAKVIQLHLTLCDPIDCSPPGSSLHRILQTRYWNGLPFPSPRNLPDPGIEPRSPALKADAFTVWATREAPIGFSNSHIHMWELDHKKGWVPKNSCFRTVVLEKTLESPLVCKEIKLVSPKGNQPWIFIGRTGAEDEAPILWPPDAKSWIIGKDADVGKDWRQKEKGMVEEEMVR